MGQSDGGGNQGSMQVGRNSIFIFGASCKGTFFTNFIRMYVDVNNFIGSILNVLGDQ